mgnify:CR=1 FL=1|tara:strand:- start:258 stop:590 length:333 start_codon:yes stop_codon:yes gene_type:complete
MSLESFVDNEANYLKGEFKKYQKAFDYLLGFIDRKQWKQAIMESLTDDDLSYSVMEDILEDYIEEHAIDGFPEYAEQLIYEACEDVIKYHPNNDAAQTIKANIERRRNKE